MSRSTIVTAGIAAVFLAVTFGTPDIVLAQETVEEIVVTGIGSRGTQRSVIDAAVPVDVLTLDELNDTQQIDIGQMLHYTAPSFNAVKFGINDLSPLIDPANAFDPTILDRRSTKGLSINKTNWANTLDAPPFKAFPVSCGITFTYAGLCIDKNAAVLNRDGEKIPGLYACGEMVGGVFSTGYPGGSGLTSGAVFGRIAGRAAAQG